MPLKTVLESLEGVDDAVKPLYKEVDKKFILDIEGVDDHPTVKNLKSAFEAQKVRNTELTTKFTEAETKLKELPEDFDAQKWLEFKTAAEKDKGSKDKAVEDLTRLHEARLTALTTQQAAELQKRDDTIGSLNGQLDRLALDTQLTDLLIKAKVDEKLMEGARAVVASKVKITRQEDGSRQMFVETNVGDQLLSDYMKTWAETAGLPYVARPGGPAAAGGGGGGGGVRQIVRSEFLKLPPAEQAATAAKAAKGEIKIVDAA